MSYDSCHYHYLPSYPAFIYLAMTPLYFAFTRFDLYALTYMTSFICLLCNPTFCVLIRLFSAFLFNLLSLPLVNNEIIILISGF